MDSKRLNTILVYLECETVRLHDVIKGKFVNKFGDKADEQLDCIDHFCKIYVMAKIKEEVTKISPKLKQQIMQLREKTWDYMQRFFIENFDIADANVLEYSYKRISELEKIKYILANSKNPFKKLRIVKKEEMAMHFENDL